MKWFEHKHRWRASYDAHRVFGEKTSERPIFTFNVEQCRCGAGRTIEFRPGAAPVIRMGRHVDEAGT